MNIKADEPSSRTSTIAIFEGGVDASRFEEVCDSRISDSEEEESRGRLAIVCIDILRIYLRVVKAIEAM